MSKSIENTTRNIKQIYLSIHIHRTTHINTDKRGEYLWVFCMRNKDTHQYSHPEVHFTFFRFFLIFRLIFLDSSTDGFFLFLFISLFLFSENKKGGLLHFGVKSPLGLKTNVLLFFLFNCFS